MGAEIDSHLWVKVSTVCASGNALITNTRFPDAQAVRP